MLEERVSFLKSHLLEELNGRETRQGFYLAIELHATDTHLSPEIIHLEVALREMFLDGGLQTVDELAVGRSKLLLFCLLILCLAVEEVAELGTAL